MFLEKLLEFPKKKTLILIIIVAFAAWLLIQLLGMGPIELPLRATTGYGVLEFEFAWTPEGINAIFTAWGADGKAKEAFVTYLDFPYLICYALFISGLIILVARSLEGKVQTIGLYMALTPIIAAIFDVVENINLLLMLTDESYIIMGSSLMASLFATIKFAFLYIGIIFFFVALVVVLIQRRK